MGCKEHRTLNLCPDGVACIPLLGLNNLQMVCTGMALARFIICRNLYVPVSGCVV